MNKYLCAFCVMLHDPELDSELVVVEAEAMMDAAAAFIEQRYPSWAEELTHKIGTSVVLVVDPARKARVYPFQTISFGQGLRAIPRGWVMHGDVEDILSTQDVARVDSALVSLAKR